jgi:hypothetical protein
MVCFINCVTFLRILAKIGRAPKSTAQRGIDDVPR